MLYVHILHACAPKPHQEHDGEQQIEAIDRDRGLERFACAVFLFFFSREQPTTADAAVPTPASNGSADAEGVEIPAPEPSGNKNLLTPHR